MCRFNLHVRVFAYLRVSGFKLVCCEQLLYTSRYPMFNIQAVLYLLLAAIAISHLAQRYHPCVYFLYLIKLYETNSTE